MSRRDDLLNAALRLAETHGYDRVSRRMVADACGCSDALLSHYWTAPGLQAAILGLAVERGNHAVLAQGLSARHPTALAAPEGLRAAAAASLLS